MGVRLQTVAGVSVPDTALAREAAELAAAALPPEIFRHTLRVFLFAELIARKKGVPHDPELVYVAAILHDTGLSFSHMSSKQRFEVDGANLARALLQKHGVATERIDLVWDAIALHDQSAIAQWKQPEVMLVSAGVGTDFGANLDVLERNDVFEVLRAAPREDFIPVFLEAAAAFVKRKPFATGGSWVTDVGYRMVPGFHPGNFVDDVRGDDPFAGF